MVDWPIENGDFSIVMLVYQKVTKTTMTMVWMFSEATCESRHDDCDSDRLAETKEKSFKTFHIKRCVSKVQDFYAKKYRLTCAFNYKQHSTMQK